MTARTPDEPCDHPPASFMLGYGLAGGGLGPYQYCGLCGATISKHQDPEMEVRVAKDIEIVEPTKEERRAIFDKLHFQRRSQPSQLSVDQQDVINRIERLIVEVGELGPGTADCDVNPMMKHPYQRQAIHALEYAHSEVLNWFDRANRGFAPVFPKDPPDEPEKQE